MASVSDVSLYSHAPFRFCLCPYPQKRQKLIPETQGTCLHAFLYTATTTAAAAATATAATATATTTATTNIVINYYLIKRGAYMQFGIVHEQLYPIQYQEEQATFMYLCQGIYTNQLILRMI